MNILTICIAIFYDLIFQLSECFISLLLINKTIWVIFLWFTFLLLVSVQWTHINTFLIASRLHLLLINITCLILFCDPLLLVDNLIHWELLWLYRRYEYFVLLFIALKYTIIWFSVPICIIFKTISAWACIFYIVNRLVSTTNFGLKQTFVRLKIGTCLF